MDVNRSLRQRPNDENKIYLIFDESEEFRSTGKYLDAYNEAIEEWNKVMKPQFEVTTRGELNEIIREQGPQTVNILRQDRETTGKGLGNIRTVSHSGRYCDDFPETRSIAPHSDDIAGIEALYGRKP